MLDNSINITYNGDTITLNRLNQDGYTGAFFGKHPTADDTFHMEVKHQFPKGSSSSGVEQHLVKLTRNQFSTVDGKRTLTAEQSVHMVLKTAVGAQENSVVLNLQNALEGVMTDAFVGMVLDRRS